jgi:flagellar biosynthesis/type III secretory pathway chaperone
MAGIATTKTGLNQINGIMDKELHLVHTRKMNSAVINMVTIKTDLDSVNNITEGHLQDRTKTKNNYSHFRDQNICSYPKGSFVP